MLNNVALYGLGTRTLFFFFSSYYSILKFVFWLPIILWIFSHYSHYSPWLGYVRSIEGLARLDARRGDSVDVELTIYYRIYTGRKELENEDDRAEKTDWRQSQTQLAAVGVAGCGRRWCHHHNQWSLHEARLLQYTAHMRITWLDFSSHYTRVILA